MQINDRRLYGSQVVNASSNLAVWLSEILEQHLIAERILQQPREYSWLDVIVQPPEFANPTQSMTARCGYSTIRIEGIYSVCFAFNLGESMLESLPS